MCLRLLRQIGVVLVFMVWAYPLGFAQAAGAASLTQAYDAEACPSCAAWNEPQEPVRIHGDSYYVGPRGLASILITTEEGHVLLDGALPNSAPVILTNIRRLGFDPADIRLILNSHPHYDHAGGIAALQQASRARVAAGAHSAAVLERGNVGPDDPQFETHLEFPAVTAVESISHGEPVRVGTLEITPWATPGHTPGGTSWTWNSCEENACVSLVYGDSISAVSSPDFRFTDAEAYPDVLADFELTFQQFEQLPCDILITTHPEGASLWEKLEKGPAGLIDDQACRKYAATGRARLQRRLAAESEQKGSGN